MGTIIERRRKDGTKSYLAQIVLKRDKEILHRENKTFTNRRQASHWIAVREFEVEQEIKGGRAPKSDPTLGAVIERYVAESQREIGRTKAQVLRSMVAMPIASMRCSEITSTHLVELGRSLAEGNRKPQTVQNYLSHISSIFAIARPAWGYPLDPQAMRDAVLVSKRLGYTSKSRKRDRRPTLDELDRLLAFFDSKRSNAMPMSEVVLFAIFSTRRQEEITRLTWVDLDREHSRVLVRDMKHPGQKIGNDHWVDLVPEAMAVIKRQPMEGDCIFPYSTDAISANFTRACKLLGIADLHFHDLRHDGISRLFEMGWNIPQVACVSGHRSWHSLQRYTHIRQRGDKYANWQKKTPLIRRGEGLYNQGV